MEEEYPEIVPGAKVMAFDHLRYRDDVSTPLSHTMRPAVVLCRYGKLPSPPLIPWNYPDLCDVQFTDGDCRIQKGKFTWSVDLI